MSINKRLPHLFTFLLISLFIVSCSNDDDNVEFDKEKPVLGKDFKIKVDPKSGETVLTWSEAVDNKQVVSYEIKQGTEAIKTIIDDGSTTFEYKFGKLTPKTDYVFTLTAKDKAGNISSPESVKANFTKDEEKFYLDSNFKIIVSESKGEAILSWNPAINNIKVDHYILELNGKKIYSIKESGKSVFTYYYGILKHGVDYTFTLKAKDKAGNKSKPKKLKVKRKDNIKPILSDDFKAERDPNSGITKFTWSKASDNGVIDHYEIKNNGKTLTIVRHNDKLENHSFTTSFLKKDKEYIFTLTAKDKSGNVSDAKTFKVIF